MDKNTTPNRNGDNKNNGRFPKNTQNMMMFLVFLMIGFLLWGFVRDQYTQATTQEVTYDKFLEMLENDEIASVEDTGATWEITPKSEENKTVKVTYYTGKMDDEGLLPLMKEKGVEIKPYIQDTWSSDHMEYHLNSGTDPASVAGIRPAHAPDGRRWRHDGCRQEQSQGIY